MRMRIKASTVTVVRTFALAVRNVIVYHRRLRFYVEHSVRFEFLKDLFEYYSQHPVRINNADIMLKRGVRLAKWEIQHKNVTIGRVLGQGAFGELKSDTELSKAKIKEMMKEARLMRDLKHPNVVCIYGVALLEHPLYIILEFVPGGALDAYLRKNKNTIDRDERLLMAMGAAWGMEYLHKSKVLHRDVAARNCLYDNDKIVKISDFGLSRRGTTYKMQTAKKMPIKWMAPESMSNFTFSQKTDVYSYGIIEGQLNQFPEGTPSKLVEFVKEKMWDKDPDNRLDMSHIVDWLEKYTGLALDMPDDSVAQDGDQTGPHKSQAVGRHSQPRTRKRPDKQDHSKKN
ncbi:protein tyrosine kinase [Ancylostoma ceylanicum]|uniref:Protein tyrosine kinase n=1 Tax=Ancylostoma ceylanicum TaxID=53326 RepID=A0A0D6LVF1_9BILA|nr:protein tyrosine kinase [Ancylostoma ceylanicum]